MLTCHVQLGSYKVRLPELDELQSVAICDSPLLLCCRLREAWLWGRCWWLSKEGFCKAVRP